MLTMQDIICWESGENFPEESGEFLAITETGLLMTMHFSARNSGWNMDDDDADRSYEIKVRYWAEIPALVREYRRKNRYLSDDELADEITAEFYACLDSEV